MFPFRYVVFDHICLFFDILDIDSTWNHKSRYVIQVWYYISIKISSACVILDMELGIIISPLCHFSDF